MEIKLVVVGGIHAGKEIPVRCAKFIIGRSKECQLRPGCNLVSRRHCAILYKNGKMLVQDLRSTNGTFVNGDKIEEPQELNPGDNLSVGTMQFEVRVAGEQGLPVPEAMETVANALPSTATIGGVTADVDEELPTDALDELVDNALAGEEAGEKDAAKQDAKDRYAGSDLDLSTWFGDSDTDSSLGTPTPESDAAPDGEQPETDFLPPSRDEERERGPETKGDAQPQRNARPTAKTAATDVLDKLNRFVAKKK